MRFTLEITAKNSEGVLERILGRLRQRNFNIQTMNANCNADLSSVEVKITVDSKFNPELITKQLTKLHDVQKVNAFSLNIENTANRIPYIDFAKRTNTQSLGEQNAVSLSV